MKYKQQYFLSSIKYATLMKHGRGAGGGFGLVHDIFWREEKPWVVLKLPTGRRLTVPAAWTDLPPKTFSTTEGRMEVHAPMLLELAQFCQDLQRPHRRATKKTSTRPTRK